MGAGQSSPRDLLLKHIQNIKCPSLLVTTINNTIPLEKKISEEQGQLLASYMHSSSEPLTLDTLSKLVDLTLQSGKDIKGGGKPQRDIISKDLHDYFQSARQMSNDLLDEREVLGLVHQQEHEMTRIAGGQRPMRGGGARAFNMVSLFSDNSSSLSVDNTQDKVSKFTIETSVAKPFAKPESPASLFEKTARRSPTEITSIGGATSRLTQQSKPPQQPSRVSPFASVQSLEQKESNALPHAKISMFSDVSQSTNTLATPEAGKTQLPTRKQLPDPSGVTKFSNFSQTDFLSQATGDVSLFALEKPKKSVDMSAMFPERSSELPKFSKMESSSTGVSSLDLSGGLSGSSSSDGVSSETTINHPSSLSLQPSSAVSPFTSIQPTTNPLSRAPSPSTARSKSQPRTQVDSFTFFNNTEESGRSDNNIPVMSYSGLVTESQPTENQSMVSVSDMTDVTDITRSRTLPQFNQTTQQNTHSLSLTENMTEGARMRHLYRKAQY